MTKKIELMGPGGNGDVAARFSSFIAIDWSGAKGESHAGIAVGACALGSAAPTLISPPGRCWSRMAVLNYIMDLRGDVLIGLDFSFAPPWIERKAYLPGVAAPDEAIRFWAYVDSLCTDADLGAASFLEQTHRQHFYLGAADGAKADYLHLRQCEAHYNASGGGKPSTVYDAIGAAQVAKASFAGMRLLFHLHGHVPIWPFDPFPMTGPVVIEIYTQIAARAAAIPKGRSKIRTPEALDAALTELGSAPHEPLTRYNDHATDALVTAAWLRRSAQKTALWNPAPLTREIACKEGWTFGVV